MIHARNLPDKALILTIRAEDAQKVARALSSLLGELDGEVERVIDGQLVRIVKLGPPPAPPAEAHIPICGELGERS
jgi:hypothetical protein